MLKIRRVTRGSNTSRANTKKSRSKNSSRGLKSITHPMSGTPEKPRDKKNHTDTLQSYLASISRYKLLTRDEERELIRKLRENGDHQATHALVTSNLRLVVKIALDYKRLWMQNLMDLIQEGNIGLIKAVEKFNPYRANFVFPF